MGFKYVLIPADINEPMQELVFEEDVQDLSNDTFRPMVEKYFAQSGGQADRVVLLKQLQERTGIDIKGQADKGEVDQKALDALLAQTSVEIFPVMLPMKENGFDAVSAYCDDKGVAKGLEENVRASGLAQACGYVAQVFRGDVFFGRVFDDTEDEWRRVDLCLADCNSDAEWVAKCRKQRENRKSSDMSNLAGKLGVNSPAQITPDMMQQDEPKGETEAYLWRQSADEVEVTFKRSDLQKGDKGKVKCVFSRQKLKVEIKGEVVIDSALCGALDAEACTWTLSDGVLQVNLAKAEEETWRQLTK